MTETERAVPRQVPATMPVGGSVVAVVPQSVEEIFRVSKGVVQSGLAPYALTGKTDTEERITKAVSAVAIVIMAGAELGLPPMVSLRSFTAINGRPALYGDGLINVVRRSGRASMLKTGYTYGNDYRLFIRAGRLPEPEDDKHREEIKAEFAAWSIDQRTGGFCEATRGDTGESKSIVFTVADAKRAGLWQTEPLIEKEVWEDKPGGGRHTVKRKVPNDSPWFRYSERMCGWRAAGFCLRDLFGDVLGGITDDWEAREIAGMVDITPQTGGGSNRPTPPTPPAEEDENQDASNESEKINTPAEEGMTLAEADVARQAELHNSDQQAGAENEVTEPEGEQHVEEGEAAAPTPPTPPAEDKFDADAFLVEIEEKLATATTPDEVEEFFDELDVPPTLSREPQNYMAAAFDLRKTHLARVATADREALEANGQTSLLDDDTFPGDR